MASWWQSRKNGNSTAESPLPPSKVIFKLLLDLLYFYADQERLQRTIHLAHNIDQAIRTRQSIRTNIDALARTHIEITSTYPAAMLLHAHTHLQSRHVKTTHPRGGICQASHRNALILRTSQHGRRTTAAIFFTFFYPPPQNTFF